MIFNLGLKRLPFRPHPQQIIYVESTYDEQVNAFIRQNYHSIRSCFTENGYEFIYLPMLSLQFDKEVSCYYNPAAVNQHFSVKSTLILDFMAHPENRCEIAPSLIYCKSGLECEEGAESVMRGITIDAATLCDTTFAHLLADIIEDLTPPKPQYDATLSEACYRRCAVLDRMACEPHEYYSSSRDDASIDASRPQKSKSRFRSFLDKIHRFDEEEFLPEELPQQADDTFDEETKLLMWEVQVRINKLKRKGIEQYVLENMFRTPIAPSRMVITSDYRILLPDYNNLEIEMTPLVKAVYILFLRHHEGIPFKCLCDYRKELQTIYSDVRGGWLTREMKRSIEAATDPFNNSINEKCARIREAFISKFDERIAESYIVRGKRGEPKRISLPRNLVEWQTKI